MNELIKEINICEIDGVSIGHAQDEEAKTGVSVLYFKNGKMLDRTTGNMNKETFLEKVNSLK